MRTSALCDPPWMGMFFKRMSQVRGRRIAPYQLPCASSRPVADFKPFVSGRKARINGQIVEVDARGFIAGNWKQLE